MDISLPVTLAVLGAALLHASWNALLKSGRDKELDVVGLATGGGAVALVAAPFLALPARASWLWIAASALVHIAYFWALAGAYRWGDMSFSYPIMRGGGPLIVCVAGGAVFGETLASGQLLGLLLISAGILACASHSAPDKVAQKHSLAFALINACVIAAYTLIDARGARLSGAPLSYTIWFFVANGVMICAIGCLRRRAAVPRHVLRQWRVTVVGGVFAIAAYAVALWAMTQAPVALVAVLRETSVVFAALLGALALNERLTARRALATLTVLAGLALLRL